MMILLTGLATAACFDTDGGKNKYEFGGVTDDTETFHDECDGENIKEYFCSAEEVASYTTLPCVNGCIEGECIVSTSPPTALAPEEETEENNNTRMYMYLGAILVILLLYIYWFKIRNKKRWK
tara:strand:- start:2023 stop:2391 length:369 start_codon:yes stop_codon:yes gene_type:complete